MQPSVLSAITEASDGSKEPRRGAVSAPRGGLRRHRCEQGQCINQDSFVACYRNFTRTDSRRKSNVSASVSGKSGEELQAHLGPGEMATPSSGPSPDRLAPLWVLPGCSCCSSNRGGCHCQPQFNPAQLCDSAGQHFPFGYISYLIKK